MEQQQSTLRHRLHIGLRTAKSLLAIFVGFWIWQLVRCIYPDLEVHPIYIYIYGLIEIRDSSEKTLDFGTRRLKATAVAMCVGLPMLALVEWLQSLTTVAWVLTAIELGCLLLGVLLALLLAQKIGCKTFCGLAAAILIVLMVSHADDGRYLYAVLRAFQTVVGVFVAWLINVKLFPYPARPKPGQKAEPSEEPTEKTQ